MGYFGNLGESDGYPAHAQEEYGRLTSELEESSSNGALRALAAIDRECERLEALKNKVAQQYDAVKLAGRKECDIDFDLDDHSLCQEGTDGCLCKSQLSEFQLDSKIPNIWASSSK
jgi:hypothetical protein